MENKPTLYQPIKFKRNRKSSWEKGVRILDQSGEKFLDYDMKEIINFYKFEVDWVWKA